jgi:hypothetical protein
LGAGICKRVIDWYRGALVSRLIPLEGNLIRRRWFSTHDGLPPAGYQTRIVQSGDVAMTTGPRNDYSVCTTWFVKNQDAYLLDVYRGRLEYPDLRRKVIALAVNFQEVVHSAPTVNADVAKHRFAGGPNGHSQECASDAQRSRGHGAKRC